MLLARQVCRAIAIVLIAWTAGFANALAFQVPAVVPTGGTQQPSVPIGPSVVPNGSVPGFLGQLAGTYPYGAVYGVALNPAGTRAYVSEGASLSALDLAALQDPKVSGLNLHQGLLGRIPVDATFMNMLVDADADGSADDDYVYVAGGDMGLLRVDLGGLPTNGDDCPTCAVISLDGPTYPPAIRPVSEVVNDHWCMDVAMVAGSDGTHPDLLVALFATTVWVYQPPAQPRPETQSELRAYSLAAVRVASGPVAPLGSVILDPTGGTNPTLPADAMSYAIAVDGSSVYVAMGTGGILKVDPGAYLGGTLLPVQGPPMSNPAQYPDLATYYAAKGVCGTCGTGAPYSSTAFFESNARVCDVAVAGGYLYAAADDRGLVEIDLAQPWGQNMAVSGFVCESPTTGPEPISCAVTYARFVAAEASAGVRRVVVGSGGSPARLAEAGPYYNYGRMGWGGMTGSCGR
ncbi:MAG: hypothetical protein HZA52_01510 [Planctomycetes bacterium]|nr:hypothetical protein [Planctomycetota bacterium]